jgi:hypothetical protein
MIVTINTEYRIFSETIGDPPISVCVIHGTAEVE